MDSRHELTRIERWILDMNSQGQKTGKCYILEGLVMDGLCMLCESISGQRKNGPPVMQSIMLLKNIKP